LSRNGDFQGRWTGLIFAFFGFLVGPTLGFSLNQPDCSIKGTVSAEGKPIGSVRVFLAPEKDREPVPGEAGLFIPAKNLITRTEENGTFVFEKLKNGTYRIWADPIPEYPCRGFKNQTVTLREGEIERVNIALGGYFPGTVRVEYLDPGEIPLIGFDQSFCYNYELVLISGLTEKGEEIKGRYLEKYKLRFIERDSLGRFHVYYDGEETVYSRIRLDLFVFPKYSIGGKNPLNRYFYFSISDRIPFGPKDFSRIKKIEWLEGDPSVATVGCGESPFGQGTHEIWFTEDVMFTSGVLQSFNNEIGEQELLRIFRILPDVEEYPNQFAKIERELIYADNQLTPDDSGRPITRYEKIRAEINAFKQSPVPPSFQSLLEYSASWLEMNLTEIYAMNTYFSDFDKEKFKGNLSGIIWNEDIESMANSISREYSQGKNGSEGWNLMVGLINKEGKWFGKTELKRIQRETLQKMKLNLEVMYPDIE
jgi:hypothetical protein